jgi:non-ribosomal peptide synthetase component F
VVRLVKNCNYIDISDEDIFLNLSTYAFDGSTFDFYSPLLNGGTVIIPREDEILDMQRIVELIKDEAVTKFWITASLFNVLAEMEEPGLQRVKAIVFGGEQGSMRHIREFHRKYPQVKLINGYGPTETTTFATTKDMTGCEEENVIAIGKPISQTTCYILDKEMRPVPVGTAGELCIGGDGLARGYLNKPELTKEKFILNPFQSAVEKVRDYNGRLYRTGDIVRYLPDGNIEYL